MKTLIINGSPHKEGDTSYIINELKNKIGGEIKEIFPYYEKISPCMDCRDCWNNEGCSIKDKMEELYKEDYDLLILASPVYMYNVTPPVFSMITRLNWIWSNKYFLNKKINLKKKQGILVLTGGGSGEPKHALDMAKLMFKFLNVEFNEEEHYIKSLNTNKVPAKEDESLKDQIEQCLKKVLKSRKKHI